MENTSTSDSEQQSDTHADDILYQIGIDCGSKTVKVCISDRDSRLVYSVYRRHRSNIKTTLLEIIHELNWRYGDLKGSIAITGSAGISVAEALGLPFVQEVVATTKIVKKEYPQADCVIELGGEDAKIIYLTGGLEQRMNATCAGGTGGFVDNIAYLLGVRTADMDKLSMGASRIYPIASRCAVFAQTDIRPLMNAGARTNDLAGSTLDAVVRQTLGGLACGRPITGTVVFLGGPFQFLSDLAVRFRKALGLTGETGIRPADAQFFTARGAGLYGAQLPAPHTTSLQTLENRLTTAEFRDDSLGRLEPLFQNESECEEFKQRHAQEIIKRADIFHQQGPVYVGIDAGSTAVKIAVVNENGEFIWGDSQENHGDVLKTTTELLRDMYANFPREYRGPDMVHIAHAVATGYGEDMLKACLGVDSGIVETTAHVQGALSFAPNVSFLLDIGGQDMKAIWVKDGLVENAILNEACSSGCGSFLSGTAYTLRLPKDSFANAALTAKKPVDLGTKCTVFMNSRLKHAQKVGADTNDLAAGCAYSVVKNALFRIIGLDNLDSLGDTIVVQGGTFMNDAVLRAFELFTGKHAIRPNRANLMGALGAALVARKRAQAQGEGARSTLLSRQELVDFAPKRTTRTCEGCANSCTLSVVTVAKEKDDHSQNTVATGAAANKGDNNAPARNYIGGNRCGRALELYATGQQSRKHSAPNAVAAQRALLERIPNCKGEGKRAGVRIGMMNTLLTYEFTPFWHAFFSDLGFTVLLPREQAERHFHVDSAGAETVPSESVCYPAKLSHRRLKQLSQAGATHVFAPRYQRGVNCAVSTGYASALQDGASLTLDLAQHMVSPLLPLAKPQGIASSEEGRNALFSAVSTLAEEAGDTLSAEELDHALHVGLAAQQEHQSAVRKANEKALAWVENDPDHHGILLLGRPYHIDAATGHRIDEVLTGLGLAVLSPNALTRNDAPRLTETDTAGNESIDPASCSWKKASHMLRLANYAMHHERIDVVALQSFGCLYDGINVVQVGDYLQKRGRLFTALKVDEITDTAHLRIRLRTLAENIEQLDLARKEQRAGTNMAGTCGAEDAPCKKATTNVAEVTPQRKLKQDPAASTAMARIPALDPHLAQYAEEGNVAAFTHLDTADIEAARSYTRDLCYSTAAIVGRSLRILAARPQLDALTLPNVCHECVLEAVPYLLERITGKNIRVTWENAWPLGAFDEGLATGSAESRCSAVVGDDGGAGCTPASSSISNASANNLPGTSADSKPLVGVIGTAPLVFDSFLNDNLLATIESHGCQPILPQPEALFAEDVRYLDQLQHFYDQGVRHVIYLQSFGCLKGHVNVRGSMHDLAKRFPGMNIVVLDYDPEASALNRENRVLLALAEALDV